MFKYMPKITIIGCLLCFMTCNDNNTPQESEAEGLPYAVGETILDNHWEMKFDFCYPACTINPDNCDDLTIETNGEADTTFSLADHTGKVFMIEMSTSW